MMMEFIKYAKEKYGLDVVLESSDTPEIFERIFTDQAIEIYCYQIDIKNEHKILAVDFAEFSWKEVPEMEAAESLDLAICAA